MSRRYTSFLLLAVLLPLVVALVFANRLGESVVNALGQQSADAVVSSRKTIETDAMKRLVKMAREQIKVVQAQTHLKKADQVKLAQQLLLQLNAGFDYYVFVYDETGLCWVHPQKETDEKTKVEKYVRMGNNYWNEQVDGKFVIRDLIKEATNPANQGLHPYRWPQPSTLLMADKLGFVEVDESWRWVVGTGMYLDGLEGQARQLQQPLDDARRHLREVLLNLALALIPVGVLGALVMRHLLSASRQARNSSSI